MTALALTTSSFTKNTKSTKITKGTKEVFNRFQVAPVSDNHQTDEEDRQTGRCETDALDEAQFAAWVKQASQLPGERM